MHSLLLFAHLSLINLRVLAMPHSAQSSDQLTLGSIQDQSPPNSHYIPHYQEFNSAEYHPQIIYSEEFSSIVFEARDSQECIDRCSHFGSRCVWGVFQYPTACYLYDFPFETFPAAEKSVNGSVSFIRSGKE